MFRQHFVSRNSNMSIIWCLILLNFSSCWCFITLGYRKNHFYDFNYYSLSSVALKSSSANFDTNINVKIDLERVRERTSTPDDVILLEKGEMKQKRVMKTTNKNNYSRLTKIEGRLKWKKEIELLKQNINLLSSSSSLSSSLSSSSSIGIIVELVKELYYSDLPQEVLEFCNSYDAYDEINNSNNNNDGNNNNNDGNNNNNNNNFSNILMFYRIRSAIKLKQLELAQNYFQKSLQLGINYDDDSVSHIVSDFARISLQGLIIALDIRKFIAVQAKQVGEGGKQQKLANHAYVGLCHGLLSHGFYSKKEGSSNNLKFLLPKEEIAVIVDEALNHAKTFSKSKKNQKLLACCLRLISRYNLIRNKHNNSNNNKIIKNPYESSDESTEQEIRVSQMRRIHSHDSSIKTFNDRLKMEENGIAIYIEKDEININNNYWLNIPYSVALTDALLQECLYNRDNIGLHSLVMNIFKLKLLRTSTLNILLDYYTNIDSKIVHSLFETMKVSDNLSLFGPNSKTNEILFDLCLKYENGKINKNNSDLTNFIKDSNNFNKSLWDRFLVMLAMNSFSMENILNTHLSNMIKICRIPVDETTVISLLNVFYKMNDFVSIELLYNALEEGQAIRNEYDNNINININTKEIDIDNIKCFLPSTSLEIKLILLEMMRNKGMDNKAFEMLKQISADHDNNNVNENISHYSHGNDISLDIFEEMVAMTMEACIVNKNPELVLEVLAFSEDYGLAKPTKRMYLALLQTFGLLNDIAGALGVFEEMCNTIEIESDCLHSLLDICIPRQDLRGVALLLQDLEQKGIDLNGYTGNILMHVYPDALSLGDALMKMEYQQQLQGKDAVYCNLDVIGLLVQNLWKSNDVDDLTSWLIKLGESGIRPDKETMEYFRLPELSTLTTTDARAMKLLNPNRRRFSVLDIDIDTSIAMDSDIATKIGNERNFIVSGRLYTPYAEKAMAPQIDPFLHEVDMINEYINNYNNIQEDEDDEDDKDVDDEDKDDVFVTNTDDQNKFNDSKTGVIANTMTAASQVNSNDNMYRELDQNSNSALEISETALMKRHTGLRNKKK